MSDLRTVFISHRHKDRRIADALREFVEDLPMAESKVHQSSFPENGPRIARNLTRELREQLHATNVVFCVFTRQDEDWSYCMWECGVATDPMSDDTRIVIFQTDGGTAWVDSLAKQIMLAGMWKFPEPDWVPMQAGATGETDWCIPVLNWIRRIPQTETIQFDVYFIPVRHAGVPGLSLLKTA